MKLRIEGDRAVELDLVDVIEFRHQRQVATAFVAAIPIVTESEILYRYYQGEGKKEFVELPKETEA
jgi:hypothetical protein